MNKLMAIFFSSPPDISHLRVFGCLCFVTDLTVTDKFQPRASVVVFFWVIQWLKKVINTWIFILAKLESLEISNFRKMFFRLHLSPSNHLIILLIPWRLSPLIHLMMILLWLSLIDIAPDSEDSIPVNLEVSLPPDASPPFTSSAPASSVLSPRVTKRPIKLPAWHQDYITSIPDISRKSNTLYPMSNHVSYSLLQPNYHGFLTSLNYVTEPSSYSQAASDPSHARWAWCSCC